MIDDILSDLQSLRQMHLSQGLSSLKEQELIDFKQQLKKYPNSLLKKQKTFLREKRSYSLSGGASPSLLQVDDAVVRRGKLVVSQGKVACLILAGGQGTRLGFAGPKGMFPITPIRHKSLLQVQLEKIYTLSNTLNKPLEVAILVSNLNASEMGQYLKSREYFGLDPSLVHLVCQEDLPFLSEGGDWFLDRPGHICTGPDGNGRSFLSLGKSGILSRWKRASIEYINVIQIDNPLADPFDFEMIGVHQSYDREIVVKCIERNDEKESVGVLVEFQEGIRIVEYSDLTEQERAARDSKGALMLPYANTGLMSFSLDFIDKHLSDMESLPWHLAYKEALYWNSSSGSYKDKAWKFECFIFDLLPLSSKIGVLQGLRELCYSPLKNATGEKSLIDVQKDLLSAYRRLYADISGLTAPDREFELDSAFWYPSPSLKAYWKGRSLPEKKYIDPVIPAKNFSHS